jgi:hypothetical protein
LLAFGLNSRRTQTNYIYTLSRDSLVINHSNIADPTYTGDPTINNKGALWFDENRNANYKLLGLPYHYALVRSGEIYQSANNAVQDILIADVNGLIRGTLPFLKYQVGTPRVVYIKQIDNSYNLSGFAYSTGLDVTTRTALSLEMR